MNVRVFITGRAYHLAEAFPDVLEFDQGATVASVLAKLADLLPEGGQLPPTCMVTLSGRHLGSVAGFDDCPLREGDEVALIVPVAGG